MAAEVARAYRAILKATQRHITRVEGNEDVATFVKEQFRRVHESAEAASRALAAGREWAALVNSIHAHKELLHTYNIDIDREEEFRERLKNTAQRVGLQLTPERER